MGDKRNKKKIKAQNDTTIRASSRLSKKKDTTIVSVEPRLSEETAANTEERPIKTSSKISGTGLANDSVEPLSRVSPSPPNNMEITTRKRQTTEQMKAIIAAELETKSDKEHEQKSIQFEPLVSSTAPTNNKHTLDPLLSLSESGLGSEIEKSKPKKKPNKKVEKKVSVITTIRFRIPRGLDNACSRIHISVTESFEDVLKKIHECIGCQTVHQKPILIYKINEVKGAKKMKLDSTEDWEDLLDELLIIGKGKKDIESVTIDIEPPADYLEDLKYTLNKGKKVKMAKSGTKATQKKQRVNLNGSESDVDGHDTTDEDGNMTNQEKKAMETLKKHLNSCELSSCHNSRCKIDKNGNHCEITWNKMRAWAQALAAGTYGVTYKKPPNTPLFHDFYASPGESKKEEPKIANEPNATLGPSQYAFGIPGQYPFWYHPTMAAAAAAYQPVPPKQNTSPGRALTSSSDDSDIITSHPYEPIEEFLTGAARHRYAGKQDFNALRVIFEQKGVQGIHELKKMSEEKLESTFGLSWGDAHFLHGRIKRSIRDTRALREGERAAKHQRTS